MPAPHPADLRRLLREIIAEAADLGELQPIHAGAAPRPGGVVPVAVPARLTVSLESLAELARLAGYADLEEAFAAVEPADAAPAQRH